MGADLYTIGNMAAAVVDSATSEVAGFPKENLIDNNPDTYWKPTSTVPQVIDIDLQTAKTVEAMIFWVQNYTTNFTSPTYYVDLSSSPDDSSYTSRYLQLFGAGPTTQPIKIMDVSGTHTYRYWRISLAAAPAILQLSAIWLCTKNSLSIWHNMPNNDGIIYHNRRILTPGGRVFTQAINSNPSAEIPRTYMFQATDYAAMLAAFNDSKGGLYPLVLVEGSDKRLVYFDSGTIDAFYKNEIAYQLYNPSVTFIESPYIPAGGTY